MMPDAIDYDEWKTGERREGACYSIYVLFQKLALAVAMATSSMLRESLCEREREPMRERERERERHT
jgi:hypothetical protein